MDDRRYPKRPILGVGAIIIESDVYCWWSEDASL
jgi:hypothetical protein